MAVQKQGIPKDPDVEATVSWLERAGLAGPAYLLLQGLRPISFVSGQGLLFLQPLLPFGTWRSAAGRFAELLSDRTRLDDLLELLEARSRGDGNAQGKEDT